MGSKTQNHKTTLNLKKRLSGNRAKNLLFMLNFGKICTRTMVIDCQLKPSGVLAVKLVLLDLLY
jgi:hypothetical protein